MTKQENITNNNGKWHRPLRVCHLVLSCAVLLALPFFLWWMDRWALGVATEAYMSWKNLAANAAPVFLLLTLLTSLSGRILWSTVIIFGLSSTLFIISKIKFQVLGQPIVLQDFYFIKSLDLASIRLFVSYANDMPMLIVAGLTLIILVLLAVLFFLEGKIAKVSKRTRIFSLLFGLGGCFIISSAVWPIDSIYAKNRVKSRPDGKPVGVLHEGLMSDLLYQHMQLTNIDLKIDEIVLSRGFDILREKALWPLADGHAQSVIEEKVFPDIIVVLSESFMDPCVVLELTNDCLGMIPNFHRIAMRSFSGSFFPPTYGGGTVRSEFEVLTGMPMTAFPEVRFPYPELPIKRISGLGSFLKNMGYRTFAIHANAGRFWDRTSAYKKMDIIDFKTINDFSLRDKDGLWYSDESMTDVLLEQLEIENEMPAFGFVISMQAHGPYTGGDAVITALRDPQLYRSLVLPTRKPEADQELRLYLYHIIQADRQLGRLVDVLEHRGRPYRLLFFGDHLPALSQVWSELMFVDGKTAREQKVPWLIAGGGVGDANKIQYAWQLPSLLLENAGLMEAYSYFAFSSVIGEVIYKNQDAGMNDVMWKALQSAAHANAKGEWRVYAQ